MGDNKHTQAIDLALMAATIAVIAVAIIASGGIGAGLIAAAPAMLALDVATVANILTKVAISKQPLDAFDLITISLVGFANAGTIARALKPVLKPTSPLFKIQGELETTIRRVGENQVARTKIENQLGKIKNSKAADDIAKAAAERQLLSRPEISNIVQGSSLKWADDLLERAMTPVKIAGKAGTSEISRLSSRQKEAVYYTLGNLRSAEIRTKMLAKAGEEVKGVEVVDFADLGLKRSEYEGIYGLFHPPTKKVYININEKFLSKIDGTLPNEMFNTVHHEFLHAIGIPRYGAQAEKIIAQQVKNKFGLSEAEVKTLLKNNELPGRLDVTEYWGAVKNEGHDLITKQIADTYLSNPKTGLYGYTYKAALEKEMADLFNKSPQHILSELQDPLTTAKAAEWLAVSKNEEVAKEFLDNLIRKAPQLESQINEIDDLQKIYREVMKVV